MTTARNTQISLEDTPYYNICGRCVRRAFLCGEDHVTGKNYEHRKQWMLDRLKVLSNMFSIDVAAYAIMSNHYHLVLHVDVEKAKAWSDEEVIKRWLTLFKGVAVIDLYRQGLVESDAQLALVKATIEQWRERLMDISWYMRCLNEHISRMANKEDNCKGRFWEGRFKSQALLDETALLTCMVYVDLNPIRAGMADSPEASDFTSIQARINDHLKALKKEKIQTTTKGLTPFLGDESLSKQGTLGIYFNETDYFTLVDVTGRLIRDDKRGHIPQELKPILCRLGINSANWVESVKHYGRKTYRMLGSESRLQKMSDKLGQCWLKGIKTSQLLYA